MESSDPLGEFATRGSGVRVPSAPPSLQDVGFGGRACCVSRGQDRVHRRRCGAVSRGGPVRSWIRDHGLLLVNIVLFVAFLVGMALAGGRTYNSDQVEHGQSAVSLWQYLRTGDFAEATFENWESEFLQMGMYVVLTAYLFQRG